MKNPTLEFLAQREVAITTQIDELNSELRGIQAAKRAMNLPAPLFAGVPVPPPKNTQSAYNGKRLTIMGMIKAVLEDRPEGEESGEIIDLIKLRYGISIPRSSMSPQLSRLKKHGELRLKGTRWRLIEANT